MNNILEAQMLSKSFFSKTVLRDLNLQVREGSTLGLLGPNGSGKTTFLKIAAGLLQPTSGKLLIDGHTPGVVTKSMVAYMPDKNYLFKWMKISDAIQFYADFYTDFDKKKMEELLDFMNLNSDLKVAALSKGMTDKLNLALILARKARLTILDEPLGGVDPSARQKILDAIVNNFSEDRTIIITTHLVRDIESLFDDVAFIADGQIILQGNAEELRYEKGKSIEEIFCELYQ